MTNRVQVFRTPTTGVAPAAGTRLAGELWLNFADFQLGMIDASKNAQKLVAVRYFIATANYVAGDFVIQAGVLYIAKGPITAGAFNSTQWVKVAAATDPDGPYLPVSAAASTYLPLAGGTLTGLVTLSGPPSAPLHAATKAYVDAGAFVPVAGGANTGLNDNRIINGDMRMDQRDNGASGTVAGYTADRWGYAASQASKGTWQRGTGGPVIAALGFPYYLVFTSSSAFTSAATDQFHFNQPVEADMVSDFAWGTAGAQSVTLSFFVNSSLTGTFSGSIFNYPATATRSYPFTYSIPTANTWTRIVLTIPGDTAGTWVMSGNAASFGISFDLGCGSNFRAAAGAWANGNYRGATGAVSVVATNGASFSLTGVKLEIGSVATPYNRQSLAKSLADCQRYFFKPGSNTAGSGYHPTAASLTAFAARTFPVTMRASPTQSGATFSLVNTNTLVLNNMTADGANWSGVNTAAGAFQFTVSTDTYSAEL